MPVRNWLIVYRRKRKMTQQKVADRVGISRAAYANIELGNRDVSGNVALRIAQLLDFPMELFFMDTNNHPNVEVAARD